VPVKKKAVATTKRLDDIFEGKFAASWIEAMGSYGDPIRTSIVNPIVAFVADYFAANPLRSADRSPRNLIQQALHKVADELAVARYGPKDQPFSLWHADTDRLARLYPHLKKAVVWDLGCGEGYLARWLAAQGARCVGVEPSKTLYKHASAMATAATPLWSVTIDVFLKHIDVFLKHDVHQRLDPCPSLMTLIAVLDGCGDAEGTLDEINSFMREHRINVPLLLTTFDPDFFCPGLPNKPVNKGSMKIFDLDHPFVMRDPAEWELTFADHNFDVLDQRPIHLDALPPDLTGYVLDLCRNQILFDADTVDLIAPRQGPFYFWIIAPRPRMPGRSARTPELKLRLPKEIISFEKNDIIEVRANLGSKVYEMLEGSANFDYAGLFDMTFSEGMFFGQMEVSQNYFASRMLGSIIALEKVVAQSFQLSKISGLACSDDFAGKLFLSMIGHLDSVSYTRLLNSKHVTDDSRSKVLPAAPLTNVRNCAAVLLNLCAKNCPSRMKGYKARMLIELTYDDLQKTIYHDVKKRRNTGLMETLALLVQCSIVDCFSANSLALFVGKGGIQDDIVDIDEDTLASEQFLHLGLIAVHYLRKAIGERATAMDVRADAIAISAYLGSEKDQSSLREIMKSIADAERRDQKQQADRGVKATRQDGARKRNTGARTATDRLDFLIENIDSEVGGLSEETRDKIRNFLVDLRKEFNFHDDRPYATKGFSKFIVVRDVWALLACAMDDKNIWTDDREEEIPMDAFVKTPQQRHRLIAYYYECVAHIGSKCGLLV
jgi:SAM-dependent methyltransferase